MANEKLYGAIEAGGTKFVCCVASGPGHIVEEIRLATTTPEETLKKTVQFFEPYVTSRRIKTIGVGCFGPLDLNPNSPAYGFITATPKPGWSNTDVRGVLQRDLGVNVAFDMDVNAAAVGEYIWGASRGCDPSLYLTIGTGIGGGYLAMIAGPCAVEDRERMDAIGSAVKEPFDLVPAGDEEEQAGEQHDDPYSRSARKKTPGRTRK